MKKFLALALLPFALAQVAAAQSWTVVKSGTLLQANYGTSASSPEYFVIDLTSSYYRLNTGPGCGWGTSIVLWPSYWSGGDLYQGGSVTTVSYSRSGTSLILKFAGTVGKLACSATVTLTAPANHTISASVSLTNTGTVTLDNRPNEAFKPVFLSSMYDSAKQWDSYNVLTDFGLYWYPASGYINAAQNSKTIQVCGGNSSWKINAPTITVDLNAARPVTGWVTASANPNNDNIGIWAGSNTIVRSYSYTATATSN